VIRQPHRGIQRMVTKQQVVPEWLTAKEGAEYLRVKTRTLLLWAREGKVKGYLLSGVTRHVWRFRQSDLDATLESPSVRPGEDGLDEKGSTVQDWKCCIR
jgi:excisionase family DNA binding protein